MVIEFHIENKIPYKDRLVCKLNMIYTNKIKNSNRWLAQRGAEIEATFP